MKFSIASKFEISRWLNEIEACDIIRYVKYVTFVTYEYRVNINQEIKSRK